MNNMNKQLLQLCTARRVCFRFGQIGLINQTVIQPRFGEGYRIRLTGTNEKQRKPELHGTHQ